ncbi:oxidative stress response regulatory protein OxyR [Gordonia polyisoprenivorans NBRC 16320 = JCM 10675]|uniref:Probable hydrogen peroxide-inducible genes activator n=1 Tax=Gordonia polyisoprenivorans TaxID=84595 RepID=A0A846WR28_9ACTN|nr:hydrogen peroxide-inducible genes activator [Gordonia polyisoprenivorans]NKY02771.1 hydrogen peroxide-inducible genes activator [Gordonia polyisoprenivorans]GAB24477.1 oxidative stress response regulatory protein OxyR [Gordonia polyisoprenivorans NBRC 16320 = JCM 10675]
MPDKTYQPSLAGLRAFVTLARKHHFGSAATELGISQPSLSQALAALEAGLGRKLIERTTRRVFLTPEGQTLLPKAIAVTDAADDFLSAAAGADDPLSGAVRLGVIPTVAPYILPRMLRGLPARLPGLELRVVEDQTARLLTALREGSLDVAVLALPAEAGGIAEIPMYDEDFVLALPVGHPLAGRKRVDPSTLADLPLLLLDEGHCLRDQALEVCRLAGVSPDLGHTRAASLATAVQCVEGGLGVTLIPETAVDSETAAGELAIARFTAPRPGRRIGLVYRASSGRDEPYRRLAAVIAGLVEEIAPVRVATPAIPV